MTGRQSAILQRSSTPARNASRSDAGGPSLRSPGFEDDDEDENEAPRHQSASGLRPRDSKRFMASVGGNLS
jgi:hypothetical protein